MSSKKTIIVAYDNYNGFPCLNFVFSQKDVSQFKRLFNDEINPRVKVILGYQCIDQITYHAQAYLQHTHTCSYTSLVYFINGCLTVFFPSQILSLIKNLGIFCFSTTNSTNFANCLTKNPHTSIHKNEKIKDKKFLLTIN